MEFSAESRSLHAAAFNGSLSDCVAIVLDGADVNAPDEDGAFPLHYASARGFEELVSFFVRHQAEVNCRDDDSNTPLHLAVEGGHAEVVTTLLLNGADPDIVDEFGSPPLFTAVGDGRFDIAQILMNYGADLNIQNQYGNTPLHAALVNGKSCHVLAAMLMTCGANLHLPNQENKTCMDMLQEEIQREQLQAYTQWCKRRTFILFLHSSSILMSTTPTKHENSDHGTNKDLATTKRVLQNQDLLKNIIAFI